MQKRNSLLAAAVGAALLALHQGAQAQAQGLEVKISGQVNRAIMNVDDGVQSNAFHVDNDISSSRLRVAGSAPVQPGLRAGVVFEVEFQSNPSNEVSFAAQDIPPEFLERHVDAFFEGGWGKLSLGQGEGAADGGTEVDLSGPAVAHWSGATSLGGGFAHRSDAGALTAATLNATISNQDFESRYDRLRYDTPSWRGFALAGSWGAKDNGRDVAEAAIRYAGDFGAPGRLAAALGYSSQDAATPAGVDDKVIGGSLSWLHSSGFNATLARSERELTGRDGTFNYVKLGYKTGRHAFSVDYATGDDQAAAGDEATMTGLGYVYTPIAWAEIYAAIKRHSLDRAAGASLRDIDIAMVGTRLKF
ncbi:MAG: porin [Betaproteobacteria bacterium]